MKSDIKQRLFQQITGAYYLIPNIKKYLNRILLTINDELSLHACAVYFKPLTGEWIFVSKAGDKNGCYTKEQVDTLSESIYKEHDFSIGRTQRMDIPPLSEAYIIPIAFELIQFGILILYLDKGSFSDEDPLLWDQIGFYISAACIGNHLLTKSSQKTNNGSHISKNYEIPVKTLLEWRVKEIIDELYSRTLPDQHIFQDIVRETEKTIIKSTLNQTVNNQSLAAKFLGINRNTLRKKIKDLNIY